jgi:hypothetical protein
MVGIVTSVLAGRSMNCGSIPIRGNRSVETGLGDNPGSYSMGIGVCFFRGGGGGKIARA